VIDRGEEVPMKDKLSLLKRRIGAPDLEVQVGRWCGFVISLAFIYLMVAIWPRVARDRADLILSLLGASTMSLLMILGLTLSIRVHRASSEGKLRGRSGEYLSYVACLVLVIMGGRMLPTLEFASVGELRVGLMLLISTCTAILSIGMLTSLARASHL
jgi:hypothetical protein